MVVVGHPGRREALVGGGERPGDRSGRCVVVRGQIDLDELPRLRESTVVAGLMKALLDGVLQESKCLPAGTADADEQELPHCILPFAATAERVVDLTGSRSRLFPRGLGMAEWVLR